MRIKQVAIKHVAIKHSAIQWAGLLFFCAFIGFDSGALFGQPKLFEFPDAPIHIQIEGPIQQLMASDTTDPVFGTMTIVDENLGMERVGIQLAIRGKSRRFANQFKPLDIHIVTPKKESPEVFLGDWRSFDLVPPRKFTTNDPTTVENQHVFAEYISYRLANFTLRYHLRVQLAIVDVIDSTSNKSLGGGYSIIRESKKKAAERYGLEKILKINSVSAVPIPVVHDLDLLTLKMFQGTIQNMDESLEDLSNYVGLYGLDGNTKFIPYDFNFTSLLDFRDVSTMRKFKTDNVLQAELTGEIYLTQIVANQDVKNSKATAKEMIKRASIAYLKNMKQFEQILDRIPLDPVLRSFVSERFNSYFSVVVASLFQAHFTERPAVESLSNFEDPACSKSAIFQSISQLALSQPPRALRKEVNDFFRKTTDFRSSLSTFMKFFPWTASGRQVLGLLDRSFFEDWLATDRHIFDIGEARDVLRSTILVWPAGENISQYNNLCEIYPLFEKRIHDLALEEIEKMARYNRTSVLREALPNLQYFSIHDTLLALRLFFETRRFSEETLMAFIRFLRGGMLSPNKLDGVYDEIAFIHGRAIQKYSEQFARVHIDKLAPSGLADLLRQLPPERFSAELYTAMVAEYMRRHQLESESVDELYSADMELQNLMSSRIPGQSPFGKGTILDFRGDVNRAWVKKIQKDLSSEFLDRQGIDGLESILKKLQQKLEAWTRDWNIHQYYQVKEIHDRAAALLGVKKNAHYIAEYEKRRLNLLGLVSQMKVDQVSAKLYSILIEMHISRASLQSESLESLKQARKILAEKLATWPLHVDIAEYYKVAHYVEVLDAHLKKRE